MTGQIRDTFLYKGETYFFVALDGEKLIIPEDYNMKPQPWSTGCWRGFYSTYEIINDSLFLKEMVICIVHEDCKPIQGIMPTARDLRVGGLCYRDLNLITPFTGRIQVGKDFIDRLYIHAGYQTATAYRTLLEFTFVDGKLISTQDISSENAQKRDALDMRN